MEYDQNRVSRRGGIWVGTLMEREAAEKNNLPPPIPVEVRAELPPWTEIPIQDQPQTFSAIKPSRRELPYNRVPTVELLMTCYKRTHMLRHTLPPISRQMRANLIVTVINDGPDDPEMRELVESEPGMQYLWTGQRHADPDFQGSKWRCPVYAFNIAVKRSTADIIILSCAEMLHVDEDLIEQYVKVLSEDSHALAVGQGRDDNGRILENPACVREQFENMQLLGMHLPFLMGMRRSRYVEIGGYDEDFKGESFDDDDLVGRLKLMGCRYVQVKSRCVHLFHDRSTDDKMASGRWHYNRELYLRRRGFALRNLNREWGREYVPVAEQNRRLEQPEQPSSEEPVQ